MGRALPQTLKRLIFHHLVVLGRSPKEVLRELFFNDPTQCSLRHLRKIASMCRQDRAAALRWRDQVPFWPGRPRLLTPQDADNLVAIAEQSRTRRIAKMAEELNIDMYGDDADFLGVSADTVRRTLLRCNLTRKVVERRHMLLDLEKRLAMFERVQHVPPSLIVDTDEMSARPDSFFQNRGWSTRGQDAVYTQITIAGHSYSVLASYTPFGWICWTVYVDESIDSAKFIHYMENTLSPVLVDRAFGLLDNARIHKTPEALACIEVVFDGHYIFSAPYANMDKPVELGFANIKGFLRQHEDDAVVQPLLWINKACERYSIRGEFGHVAEGHFNMYRRNHEFYVNNL